MIKWQQRESEKQWDPLIMVLLKRGSRKPATNRLNSKKPEDRDYSTQRLE